MKKISFFLSTYGFSLAVIAICLSPFFEVAIIPLPLTFLYLLLLFIFTRSVDVFLVGFFVGILIDILMVQQIGLSSIFFIFFLFLTSLYSRKYEVQTIPYVFIMTFASTFLYLLSIKEQVELVVPLLSAFLGTILFVFLQKLKKVSSRHPH